MTIRSCVMFSTLIALAGGCAKKFPAIVPAEGVVLLNGKPLPKASITFIPILEHFGAESYSTAVTDEQGRFTLTCHYNGQTGVAVGQHVVVITEASLPDNMRGVQDGRVVDAYRAKLGNRPIPPEYTSFSRTPLRVEVSDGQGPLTIELIRP